ncbi:unnamed protein product, partial [Iphiclides podalirius]
MDNIQFECVKLFYPYLKTSSLHRDFLFASGSEAIAISAFMKNENPYVSISHEGHIESRIYHESGCEADMLEGSEVGRHSPPRPQQEPINLKNEVSPP